VVERGCDYKVMTGLTYNLIASGHMCLSGYCKGGLTCEQATLQGLLS